MMTDSAISSAAGVMPHRYIVANTKASEIETGLPSRRVITTGRSSLSTTTTTIIASGGPMSVQPLGVSWKRAPDDHGPAEPRAHLPGEGERDSVATVTVAARPAALAPPGVWKDLARTAAARASASPIAGLYGRTSAEAVGKPRGSAVRRAAGTGPNSSAAISSQAPNNRLR